uniref:TRAF family member-associated NFKB activator n=1 Tax=Anabas testudineus TaxID=64144 RepID=A0A7N6A7X2_ANATE
MEEAYTELYQQFLRLRSLCLRQAALLHQLTTVLQKERGAAVPNGQLSDMMSIPVQCTQEIPVYFHEKPQPLAAAAQSPAAQCGVDFFTSNKGTFSNLLAEDMAKLSVDMPHQRKEDDILEQRMLLTDRTSLDVDFLSQSGGLLMSDVALQSHVCDFCQAVFPGDTTTRGEFLRHLHTHIT